MQLVSLVTESATWHRVPSGGGQGQKFAMLIASAQ